MILPFNEFAEIHNRLSTFNPVDEYIAKYGEYEFYHNMSESYLAYEFIGDRNVRNKCRCAKKSNRMA